jgi:hypothetical protein
MYGRYQGCWAGDVRLGLCLRDAGVLLAFNVLERRLFNPVTPHWSSHAYYENPCKRVVSFHHLSKESIQILYDIERKVHMSSMKHLKQLQSSSNSSQFDPNGPYILPAGDISPFYSPINLGDVWDHFVEADPSVPAIESNMSRQGETYKVFTGAKNPEHCRRLCQWEEKCRAWEFKTNRHCDVKNSIPRPVPKVGHSSGIVKGRFRCEFRSP